MDKEIKELLISCGCTVYDEFVEVPCFVNGAHCGAPDMIASEDYEMYQVVKALTKAGAMFCLPAHGDSMIGNGIDEGDLLMVRQQSTAQDGDIVIAIIDGDSVTVKNYIEYDDGEVWLVPSNQRHVPIRPCDHQSCLIIGKVMSIEKSAPRAVRGECVRMVREVRSKSEARQIDNRMLARAFKVAQTMVRNKRHWFSVYRVLVDRNVIEDKDFAAFESVLNDVMGEEAPELDMKDLRKLDVMCMSKPVSLWDVNDSGMSGNRFYEYLNIAKAVLKELR